MSSLKEKDIEKALKLDNAGFVVRREKYNKFLAALDKPPKSIPALSKLFSSKSAAKDSVELRVLA